MRNVILSLVLVLGCSTEGDGLVAPGPDAGALKKGVQASGVETGQQAEDAQPRASQDAQAPDSVVVADARPAQPDTLVMAPDTYPSPPPVTWEPGPETTDPALMVCPPTKGNSLGIGKPCTLGREGECMTGTACQCGSKDNLHSLLPNDMPCMCLWHSTAGATSTKATCDPCGEGAGCCIIRGPKFVDRTCLPNKCFFNCRGS